MVDLDKYEESIIFKQELECGGVIAVGRDDLLHIVDRLRQAEKDAGRYRWLRDVCKHRDWHAVGASDPSEWDEIIDGCHITRPI